ncbi:hypothetical protein IFM89_022950 [Coptis chinensis]|uniref:Aminotransferase-like plant mobile domain-containing protein n=1 Tax=Coptis chinensis TaxID=261450 RepID=A0A835HP51_9MAGN|nr:hypothetical protein IFM89_022950 [Coptis chinensis]
MILAELLIGLTNCVINRHTKLSGCIPLLQVWAYEHLSNSLVKMKSVGDSRYNLVKTSISKRPCTIPKDADACCTFLVLGISVLVENIGKGSGPVLLVLFSL